MTTNKDNSANYKTIAIKRNKENSKIDNVIINITDNEILISIKEGYNITYKDLMIINQSILERLDSQEQEKK